MDLSEYEKFCETTAIYPKEHALTYLALGLTSEAGEVAGKVKKVLRDFNGVVDQPNREKIKCELSDVAWYFARLCNELGYTMAEVIAHNQAKLQSRKDRGVIQGNGDNR